MKMIKKLILAAIVSVASAFSLYAQLPSVQIKDLAGKPVDTATLSNDGKPMVISFWATWCKPCLRELKSIQEVYPDWQEETGVKLFAVSVDEAQNASKVKPLVDRFDWEYEVLLDPNGDFKRAMGVSNVPHVVILDGEGKIVESHSGYTEGSEEHILEKLRELTAK